MSNNDYKIYFNKYNDVLECNKCRSKAPLIEYKCQFTSAKLLECEVCYSTLIRDMELGQAINFILNKITNRLIEAEKVAYEEEE